ncbi:MAG: hypothetical protein IT350_07940 [Deltaproteobacteria bacterium]|nr:hypothetical protein [Deltaproteobacteria bacterium]
MSNEEFEVTQPVDDDFERKLRRLESAAGRLDECVARIDDEIRMSCNQVVKDIPRIVRDEIGRYYQKNVGSELERKGAWWSRVSPFVQLSFVISLLGLGVFNFWMIMQERWNPGVQPRQSIAGSGAEDSDERTYDVGRSEVSRESNAKTESEKREGTSTLLSESDTPDLKGQFRKWLFENINAETLSYIIFHQVYGQTNRTYLFDGDQHDKLNNLSKGGSGIVDLKSDELKIEDFEKLIYSVVVHGLEKSLNPSQINKDNWSGRMGHAVEYFRQQIQKRCIGYEKVLPGTADFRRIIIMSQISTSTDDLWKPKEKDRKLTTPPNPCPKPN